MQDITEKMGMKPLPSKAWAKTEVLLGSLAEITGVLYAGFHTVQWATKDESALMPVATGAALYVLGRYISSAGNRSMIYRSLNSQTAYLERVLK